MIPQWNEGFYSQRCELCTYVLCSKWPNLRQFTVCLMKAGVHETAGITFNFELKSTAAECGRLDSNKQLKTPCVRLLTTAYFTLNLNIHEQSYCDHLINISRSKPTKCSTFINHFYGHIHSYRRLHAILYSSYCHFLWHKCAL